MVPLAAAERAAVTINVTDLLANEPRLPLPVRQRAEALVAYYQENGGPLMWVGRERMDELVARLYAASDDGLDPKSYPADQLAKLVEAVGHTDARSRAIIELYFSAAFLEYASDLRVGRLLPHKVDPNFFLKTRTIDQLAALNELGRARSVAAFFDAWQPQAPDYAALKRALADYRAIADAGGWPSVPLGNSLKPGMTDDRVPLLRARLFLTDGAPRQSSGPPGLYDQGLVDAVKWFQKRHGLEDDGIVGRNTVAALNVPVEDRIAEIIGGHGALAVDAGGPGPRSSDRQHRRLRPQARRQRQGGRPDGGGGRQALQPHAGVQRPRALSRIQSVLERALRHRRQGGAAQAADRTRRRWPRPASRRCAAIRSIGSPISTGASTGRATFPSSCASGRGRPMRSGG